MYHGTTIPDWINAIAAAVGAGAVLFGLLAARTKINEVQENAKTLRRSELAEEAIALTLKVGDAFRDIRNPFDRVPTENAGDKHYLYQKRFERVIGYNKIFDELRDAQIRLSAVIDNSEVDDAIKALFNARHEVLLAIEFLSEGLEPSARDEEVKLRRNLYGSFTDRDELGKKIDRAVETVCAKLKPIARLES